MFRICIHISAFLVVVGGLGAEPRFRAGITMPGGVELLSETSATTTDPLLAVIEPKPVVRASFLKGFSEEEAAKIREALGTARLHLTIALAELNDLDREQFHFPYQPYLRGNLGPRPNDEFVRPEESSYDWLIKRIRYFFCDGRNILYRKDVQGVMGGLHQMAEKIDSGKVTFIKCQSTDTSPLMRVVSGTDIEVYDLPAAFAWGTLLHEVAHLPGRFDIAYYNVDYRSTAPNAQLKDYKWVNREGSRLVPVSMSRAQCYDTADSYAQFVVRAYLFPRPELKLPVLRRSLQE